MFGRKKSTSSAAKDAEQQDATPGRPSGDGPHERSDVDDVHAYYADLGYGYLDLGALVIGIPPGHDLNVTVDQKGNPEFHIVSRVARVIPHVYAAPKSAGQWRSVVTDLRAAIEQQGADASIVDGPWGRELVATLPGGTFRALGVDGHRWMTEIRVMSTAENAEAATEQAREVMRRLLVQRGDGPMPAREHLPLTVPEDITRALAQAQQQAAQQQQAQAYQQQMAAGGAQQAQPRPEQPPAQNGASPTPPRRDGSAMDRLRGDDDL